jgi:hypothetical protein
MPFHRIFCTFSSTLLKATAAAIVDALSPLAAEYRATTALAASASSAVLVASAAATNGGATADGAAGWVLLAALAAEAWPEAARETAASFFAPSGVDGGGEAATALVTANAAMVALGGALFL